MVDPERINVDMATRVQLQAYLENRGFTVHEHEATEELREAARLDMEERPTTEFDPVPPRTKEA